MCGNQSTLLRLNFLLLWVSGLELIRTSGNPSHLLSHPTIPPPYLLTQDRSLNTDLTNLARLAARLAT